MRGSLHRHLGIPEDQKIPTSKLSIKSSDSETIRRKKQFAINSRSWKKVLGGYLLPKALMGIDLNNYQSNIPIQQWQMSTPADAPKVGGGMNTGTIGGIVGMVAKPINNLIQTTRDKAEEINPNTGAYVNINKATNTAAANTIFNPFSSFKDKDMTFGEKMLGFTGIGGYFAQKNKFKRLEKERTEDTRNAYSQAATNNYSGLINQQLRFAFGGNISKGTNIVDYKGATHGEGGIEVDATGTPTVMSGKKGIAETEDNEFSWNGYVYSDKLKYNG
jgi:hypothetical protein